VGFTLTLSPKWGCDICDVMSILFELENPFVEHLEGFILRPEGGEL
jgi:hypothetical protein